MLLLCPEVGRNVAQGRVEDGALVPELGAFTLRNFCKLRLQMPKRNPEIEIIWRENRLGTKNLPKEKNNPKTSQEFSDECGRALWRVLARIAPRSSRPKFAESLGRRIPGIPFLAPSKAYYHIVMLQCEGKSLAIHNLWAAILEWKPSSIWRFVKAEFSLSGSWSLGSAEVDFVVGFLVFSCLFPELSWPCLTPFLTRLLDLRAGGGKRAEALKMSFPFRSHPLLFLTCWRATWFGPLLDDSRAFVQLKDICVSKITMRTAPNFTNLVSHYSAIGDTVLCDAPYSAIGFRGKFFLRCPPC